jgi:hypothetical protein
MADILKLTFDGKEYDVDQFSEEVKNLVFIFNQWQADLIKDRLAVAKGEAAMRSINTELTEKVAKEIKERESANDEDFTEVFEVSDVDVK